MGNRVRHVSRNVMGVAMPIIANIPLEHISLTVISVLELLRKSRNLKMNTIKINGYFLYRYRGILLIRKSFSDIITIHDFNAVKKYIRHVMNSILRNEYVTWAKTSGLIEIIIDAKKGDKLGIIIIEATNDKMRQYDNFCLRIITHEIDTAKQIRRPSLIKEPQDINDLLEKVDEVIIEEDLKKLIPIDVYEFLEPSEIDNIMNIILKFKGKAMISEERQSEL